MRELRLVGVDDDGSHLLLTAGDQEFTLPLDERLHAALRGDRARLGQLEIQLDSQLRPREIQARVRTGEPVDQVALAAGVPADRVLRFARPVLAERAHVAERARRAVLRRHGGEGAAPLLDDAVTGRLADAGVDTEAVTWDAWRREDGRWFASAGWRQGGRPRSATWSLDASLSSVSPTDDDSRWLSGEAPSDPLPAASGAGPARLSVLPGGSHPHPAEVPLDREAAPDPDPGEGEGEGEPEPTATAAAVPPDEAVTQPVSTAAVAAAAGRGSTARAQRQARRSTRRGDDRLRLSELASRVTEDSPGPGEPAAAGDAPDLDERPAPRPAGPSAGSSAGTSVGSSAGAGPAARGRRPSVPSWDEIMFGRRP